MGEGAGPGKRRSRALDLALALASGLTVRHLTLDQGIEGSNPSSPANCEPLALRLDPRFENHHPRRNVDDVEARGSKPFARPYAVGQLTNQEAWPPSLRIPRPRQACDVDVSNPFAGVRERCSGVLGQSGFDDDLGQQDALDDRFDLCLPSGQSVQRIWAYRLDCQD